jgi:hypothetical protein
MQAGMLKNLLLIKESKSFFQIFTDYYNVLFDARTVAKALSTDVAADFESGIHGLSAVLQRLNHESPGSIFTIKDYTVDLRRFCALYKDGGKGYELLLDLLKFRKFIQTELAQKVGFIFFN